MIFRNAASAAALAMLALSACGEPAPDPEANVGMRLPASACKQAREALDKLSTSGAFEYDAQGTATMNENVWLSLSGNQRDGVAQALAAHASCSAEQPSRETEIVVRNEFGRVLTQRAVETSPSLSEIVQ